MQYRSYTKLFSPHFSPKITNPIPTNLSVKETYDVFINHREIDTKRTLVSLLYNHFSVLKLRAFLDNKALKSGDKLFENINCAITNSKMAITVFSPTNCNSYLCLHELALIMESKKKVIPIFCDVKSSELGVCVAGKLSEDELRRYRGAVEEAKYTVGLTFNTLRGNWSDGVTKASDIVIESLLEMEALEKPTRNNTNQILL